MALVPLGNYVFFLAQLQTFGYVAVYFGALFWRYRYTEITPAFLSCFAGFISIFSTHVAVNRAGIVTKQMLDTPKKQFFVIGALEAAAQILGFIGAAKLPGGLACMRVTLLNALCHSSMLTCLMFIQSRLLILMH